MPKIEWDTEVKNILKAELAKRDISRAELKKRLGKIGVSISIAAIDSKFSRGTFSALFFLQCLRVIGCNSLKIGTVRKRKKK